MSYGGAVDDQRAPGALEQPDLPRATGPTVGELGEDALLAQVFPLLPAGRATALGPGDDAAVVSAPDGRTVVSTDVLVAGRHFRTDWSTGADVGWRAAMQNLADVAAMGARGTAVVVGLVMPPDLPVAWVLDLAHGLAAACGPSVGVVGGDLSGGTELVVSVTVLGDLAGREPVLRSGARVGDVLAHAGVRGRSAAGLAALTQWGRRWPEEGRRGSVEEAVGRYLRPVPPLGSGPAAADAGVTAMLDVSDGLLRDAGRLARASGVALDLADPLGVFADDVDALRAVADLLGAEPAARLLGWLLTGGEDHGLLATFPPDVVLPPGFHQVGTVVSPLGLPGEVTVEGRAPEVAGTGWDHFRR